jgi:hypothetical protein
VKLISSTDQQRGCLPAKDDTATEKGVAARCDSASSTHAAAFLTWATEQSANRRMSIEQFLQQHCTGSCKLPLDALGAKSLGDVLSATGAAAGPPASDDSAEWHPKELKLQQKQQPEPFAPHDGWLQGPPKPACHEARIAAADGINALRQTRDGEIGAP